ncbi:MAG: hypothetical protein AAGC55_31635, partial [Myxococcota bacterium]
MKRSNSKHELHKSKRLRITLDERGQLQAFNRITRAVNLDVFAPAIMDVSTVPSGFQTGSDMAYVHLTGPFQASTRRGQRCSFRNIGPLPLAEAEDLAQAVRGALNLPAQPVEVPYEMLVAEPNRYHNCMVRCRGSWRRAADTSFFAGAWLSAPDAWHTYGATGPAVSTSDVIVDAVGLWSSADPPSGAPQGRTVPGWPAVFDVYLLEVLTDWTALEPAMG